MFPSLKLRIFFYLCFGYFGVIYANNAQSNFQEKVEKFIVSQEKDSATFYLNKLKDSDYKNVLVNINYGREVSYKQYHLFLLNLYNSYSIDNLKILEFINREIDYPKQFKKIDLDFFNIRWMIISHLEEDFHLEESNQEQKKLEDYINNFSSNTKNFLWATTKLQTHNIVMYFIERNIDKGRELVLENLKIAESLEDKELQIAILFNYSYYFAYETNYNKVIECLEKCLELESKLPNKTHFYYPTIRSLANVLIATSNNYEKIFGLLNYLDNSNAALFSRLLYAQLIGKLNKDSEAFKLILKKFQVENVLELAYKLVDLDSNSNSNSTSHYYLVDKCAIALNKHKYYDEAFEFKNKANILNQKIYSEETSKSLASFEVEQAVKLKEVEIRNEKEKSRIYIAIATLVGVFLVISLFIIRKIRMQSKELRNKNKFISKTLKEKELLVKEVHHRVKNNFQIVSSLLELQSKGIEDEKALALANEGKNRVKSMALIHQKLYQNETGLVDFDEYLGLLVKELNALYASGFKINTSISSDNMKFDVDTAIPLGLIINEIITNSYKYAFKADKENKLNISINKNSDQDFKLIIEDNGPGIPKNLEVKKAKSLGLRLVNRLVKQLHGTLEVISEEGTRFEIFFKDDNARQLVN